MTPRGGARAGAGRKRIGDVTLAIRIPQALADWLDAQIDSSAGRSGVARKLLEERRAGDEGKAVKEKCPCCGKPFPPEELSPTGDQSDICSHCIDELKRASDELQAIAPRCRVCGTQYEFIGKGLYQGKCLCDDRSEQIEEFLNADLTQGQIAKKLGVSRERIRQLVNKYGLWELWKSKHTNKFSKSIDTKTDKRV